MRGYDRAMHHRPIALLATVALAAAAPAALAATKNGITPTAPKAGSTVPSGKSTTFKLKVNGPGQVYIHVCKSAKKDKKGMICHKESIFRAKKKSGTSFQAKAPFFDYPAFWLNSPGTYYWQAYRIDCSANINDCQMEGPVTRFKVG